MCEKYENVNTLLHFLQIVSEGEKSSNGSSLPLHKVPLQILRDIH